MAEPSKFVRQGLGEVKRGQESRVVLPRLLYQVYPRVTPFDSKSMNGDARSMGPK